MTNFKIMIGEKIRRRREELGFKAKDLALAVGVDPPQVSRWENGKRRPDPVFRESLCRILKVDESFFDTVEEQGQSPQSKSDLVVSIIGLLTALNDTQLRVILNQVEAATRLNAPKVKAK